MNINLESSGQKLNLESMCVCHLTIHKGWVNIVMIKNKVNSDLQYSILDVKQFNVFVVPLLVSFQMY